MCIPEITRNIGIKKGKKILRLLEERNTLKDVIKRLDKKKYQYSYKIFELRIKQINQELSQ